MDKSQKIWVNELYLLKFTVCKLTNRVRKLENFVAYSLDNLLANIEDKIKILETKAFSSLPDHYNNNNYVSNHSSNIEPPQPPPQIKMEENLSQINHETIVPSPFVEDLHGVLGANIKDSDVLTLAESLAEFEPIINDPDGMSFYNLGGDTDRSVFEIMDYEAAQQLLLGPLDLLHHQKSLLFSHNSEVLTHTNHPVNPVCSNIVNSHEAMGMLIDFQPPSPSHEIEITECSEVTVSDEVGPLMSNCDVQNVTPYFGNSDNKNASVPVVEVNHTPVSVLPTVKSSSKKEKPSATGPKKHIKNGKSNLVDAETLDGAFLCSQCGKQFSTLANLKRHSHSHEQKVFFPCSLCKRRYESEARLKRHKTEKHPPATESEFYCEYCKLYFNNPFAFTNHRLNVHPE